MKYSISTVLFLLILFFCFGCKEDEPTAPVKELDEIIENSAIIGVQGGELKTEEIVVSVPNGAFNSDSEIKITRPSGSDPFDQNRLTPYLQITNIPADFSKPIQIKLKLTESSDDYKYIAVGEETFAKSLSESVISYKLLDAVEKDGFIECTIHPYNTTAYPKMGLMDRDFFSIHLQGLYGRNPVLSNEGHFSIRAGDKSVSVNNAIELAGYLEEAYTKFKNMGYSYENRTTWPIEVTLKTMDKSIDGFSNNSMWGTNYDHLEFNSLKLYEPDTIRITAGHEFHHFIQGLYDPRNSYSRAKSVSDHYWFDEASAVWSEEYFTDDKDYLPNSINGAEIAPFNGMHQTTATIGSANNIQQHGYGMASMVKYIVNKYGGEKLIPKIYKRIYNGHNIVDAIEAETELAVAWYQDFLNDLMLSNIYPTQVRDWVGNIAGTFKINTANDTLKTFNKSCQDLSGNIYQIKLLYSAIDSSASLKLSAEGDLYEITAYKYNSSTLEKLGSSVDMLTINKIRELKDQGWHILVLVSYPSTLSPHTRSHNISFKIKVENTNERTDCNFYFNLNVNFKQVDSDSTTYYSRVMESLKDFRIPGSYSDDIFTGSLEKTQQDGGFAKGDISVKFNPARTQILDFTYNEISGYPPSSEGKRETHVTLMAGNIPLIKISEDEHKYEVTGGSTASKIREFKITAYHNDVTVSVENFTSDVNSKFYIRFLKPLAPSNIRQGQSFLKNNRL